MSTLTTTRGMMEVFAHRVEDWRSPHLEIQRLWGLEDRIAWGVQVFRFIMELEAQADRRVSMDPEFDVEDFLRSIDQISTLWLEIAEIFLERAQEFERSGYDVANLMEFEATVREARCHLGNIALEKLIPPLEDLRAIERPHNPRPDRYRD